MEGIKAFFSNAWEYIASQRSNFGLTDLVDILIVSVLLYYIMRFIRDRRAGKLAVGVVFLIVFQIISGVFDMAVLRFLMQNVFQMGLLALIVVFQPELRSMLENMGGESLKNLRIIGEQKDQLSVSRMISALCEAVSDLSETKTGALVVIERYTKLGDVINSGTIINADMTPYLLKNIFFNKAPLHDGAVVLRDGRIYAAGCLLPLSSNGDIIKNLGTRHRAAIGMSENSDAVVVVVSEETGTISIARGGVLKRNYDTNTLRWELEEILLESAPRKRLLFFRDHAAGNDKEIKDDKNNGVSGENEDVSSAGDAADADVPDNKKSDGNINDLGAGE